jgi:hypothetical protein
MIRYNDSIYTVFDRLEGILLKVILDLTELGRKVTSGF